MRILLFYLHYYIIFYGFYGFLSLCLPCRPWFVTPSGVEPSQASRGEWWRLFAILTDGGSLNKNTLDYENMFPPMESNHRKAMPGAGWGGDYFFTLASTQQYIRSRGTLSSAAYQSGSSS